MYSHFIILLIFLKSFLLAQIDLNLENCVHFNVSNDRSIYYPGENFYLNVDIKIDKGYHIYSTHPEKSLSPTYIEILDTNYFEQIGILHEPTPLKKFDNNFNQYISYHIDAITLTQDFKLIENIKPGIYNISGIFSYLACDLTKCIPKWDDFNFTLQITNGIKRVDYNNKLDIEYSKINTNSDHTSSNELGEEINKGLFSFVLFSLGMGFLALLTPCVFPMIPITVSYFTKEGEKDNTNPFFSASLYAAGIIAIFTSLGLILSFTIGASGAGDLAANPWVNLLIACLFIYLAFSLFGYYEIQVPSILRQYSIAQEDKGGNLGILFMSLTFTLTSFTCTVAFVGALLATASQGQYFWPIIGMLSFSLAFASPFFFLALFPQYLSRLPQSGGWLNSVKVVMGFLELAAALKFISNSDLVWNWGIFNRSVVLSIWALLFILTSIYLLGFIKMPFDSKMNKLSSYRMFFSCIFLSIGLYLCSGLFDRKVHGLIESYLPPSIEENWVENIENAYILSRKNNQPIFIDFTGYTCTNCRWMEINIFEDDKIKELFNNFILTKLYTDGKEVLHKKNREFEINRFGTAALPFYVILSPEDKLLSSFAGMDSNKENFIKFLEEGIRKSND